MDDITHALAGWAVAEAGPARRWGGRARAALVLSSVAPDLDGILALAGRSTYLLEHRGFTHSLPGLLPTALLVAAPLWLLTGRRDFRALLGLCAAGTAVHILFDCVNAWGTMVLYPFSRARVQFDAVFILDAVFTGILLVSAAAARWRGSPAAARAGLVVLAAYLAVCGLLHRAAVGRLEAIARDRGWVPVETAAVPMPPWAARWSGIAVGDSAVHQAWFDLGGRLLGESSHRRPTAEDRARLGSSPDGRAFLQFARFPVVQRDGDRLLFRDARFFLPPGWPAHHPFTLVEEPGRPPAWQ